MQKLLLTSILLATILIPLSNSRDPNARRGLSRTVGALIVFNALYLFGLIYVYPRL